MSDNSCKSKSEEKECEALKENKLMNNQSNQLTTHGVSHNAKIKPRRTEKARGKKLL